MFAERVDYRLRVEGVPRDPKCSTDLRPRLAASPGVSHCFGECLVDSHRCTARLLHRAPSVGGPVTSGLDPEAARTTNDPQSWLGHRDLRVDPAAKPSPMRLWKSIRCVRRSRGKRRIPQRAVSEPAWHTTATVTLASHGRPLVLWTSRIDGKAA